MGRQSETGSQRGGAGAGGSVLRSPTTALAVILTVALVVGLPSPDVQEYVRYAHAFWRTPAFTRWPREYPPAAVLVMLPGLLGPPGFCVATAVAAAGTFEILRRETAPGAVRWLWLVALGSLFTLVGRYDVWPALAGLLTVLAARRERWGAAWGWAVAAACLKLFGLALMPVLLAAEWRRTGRLAVGRAAAALGAFAASWVVPWLLSGPPALSAWVWLWRRPVEVESLAAPVLAALGGVLRNRYDSVSIVGPWDRDAAFALTALAVAGVLWSAWGVARGRLTWEQGAAAAVTWLVAGGKVLSAQYLLWLLPLWVLAWPAALPAVVYAAAALTTVVWPLGHIVFVYDVWFWVADAAKGAALLLTALLLSGGGARLAWPTVRSLLRPAAPG